VLNFRDLADNVSLIKPGILFRSGFFASSPEMIERALRTRETVSSIRQVTVVDLRTDSERRRHRPSSLPQLLRYYHRPIPCGDILYHLGANPGYKEYTEFYWAMAQTKFPFIRFALTTIATSLPYPIVIGCSLGKDRTGIVVALLLAAVGATRAEIVSDYVTTATVILTEPEKLTSYALEHHMSIDETFRRCNTSPLALDGFLYRIECTYGSVCEYLIREGISKEVLDRLGAIKTKVSELGTSMATTSAKGILFPESGV